MLDVWWRRSQKRTLMTVKSPYRESQMVCKKGGVSEVNVTCLTGSTAQCGLKWTSWVMKLNLFNLLISTNVQTISTRLYFPPFGSIYYYFYILEMSPLCTDTVNKYSNCADMQQVLCTLPLSFSIVVKVWTSQNKTTARLAFSSLL